MHISINTDDNGCLGEKGRTEVNSSSGATPIKSSWNVLTSETNAQCFSLAGFGVVRKNTCKGKNMAKED